VDLGKYEAVTKPIVLDFDGEILNVQYRPNIYTLGFVRELSSDDVDKKMEAFARLIASWDLYLNGEIVPLTAEGLSRVPLQILKAIDSAIEVETTPSEDEKKGSSEPSDSPPTTSTELSPNSPPSDPILSNGSQTSESPTVSTSVPSS